jgi:hypothetical protein
MTRSCRNCAKSSALMAGLRNCRCFNNQRY